MWKEALVFKAKDGTCCDHFSAMFSFFKAIYCFACSPENICDFFVRICLGIWHCKMAEILGEIFSGLRPGNKARNFGANSGQHSGQKFEKLGELSFCNFSDLTFLGPRRVASRDGCLQLIFKEESPKTSQFSKPPVCGSPGENVELFKFCIWGRGFFFCQGS